MRILALEPYDGGSHRAFLDGWRRHSRLEFAVLGLPARHWKWRMRHAAVTFAEQVAELVAGGESWDALFCSDMLNLAEFRGLCPAVANLPAVVYLHENQLTYPVRFDEERDFHFGYTNFTTCLAADAVWFNSEFHRREYLAALRSFLKRMPDFQSLAAVDAIESKSSIQPPGIAPFPPRGSRLPGPLHIVWAARWEHDKNPEDFFAAIAQLMAGGADFRVSVIGEQFRDVPAVFGEYREKLADRVDRWGFQPTREEYRAALAAADVYVSTANHEFFGIAAVEAMAAGCWPLLPNRLAYPELLVGVAGVGEKFLYDGSVDDLARRLTELCTAINEPPPWQVNLTKLLAAIQRFQWTRRARALDEGLEDLGI